MKQLIVILSVIVSMNTQGINVPPEINTIQLEPLADVQLNRGILITIEGIDGSGKSTLAHNLYAILCNYGLPVLLTREPGKTELGAIIRSIVQKKEVALSPQAEYLLFAANRAQHFDEFIVPCLANNKLIISDRMADSSIVYQGVGRGLDIQTIKMINNWTMRGIKPDLTIYLRITPETAITRLGKRKSIPTRFEQEAKHFIQKLSSGFDNLFENNDIAIIIDGEQDITNLTNKVTEQILQWLEHNNIIKK